MASGLQWQEEHYACEVFDNQFFDRCERCQTYGHHAHVCTGPLRCGRCTEGHLTKLCKASLTKCVSCNRRHEFGSSRCRAKRALAKCYARFPTAEDSPPLATPSEGREDFNTSLDSLAVNFQWRSEKKTPPNLAPAQIHTEATDKATLSPQQLQDANPPSEDALGSDKSAKRGLTSTTEGFEPAQKPRVKRKRELAGKQSEKRRAICEDPARKPGVEKRRKVTSR